MSAPFTDRPKHKSPKSISLRWAIGFVTFLLGTVLAVPARAQCGSDPGNGDTTTATPLGGCLQASFCLDFADDVDFYRIDPQFPADIVFETLGSTDTFMELLNAAGQVVEQDDDDGQNSNALIDYFVEGGSTYYIKVRGYSASTTGAYDLLVSGCCGADPYNNDFNHTTPYSGALISENIDCPGDVDIYRSTATDAGTYTFSFNPADSIVWAFYDSGNVQTTTYSNVATRDVDLAAGENLHIAVKGYYSDSIGAYSLQMTGFTGGGGCGDDPGNDDSGSATDLGSQCGITGAAIDCDGDYDFYRFTAPSSDSYNLYTAGGTDTYLTLYDDSGSPLTSDDDSAQDTNASIVFSLTQGSTYFIAVNEFGDNATGSYHLYVSGCPTGCGNDPGNDSSGEATALAACGTTQAAIDCAGDDDYYVFQAASDAIYTWTLSPTNRGAMVLYAADASTETDVGQSTVSATMISGDTAYLWVSAATNSDTFNYDLNLSGCTGGGCGNDPGNDDIPNATAIGSQCGSTQGAIDCLGDQDFYRFIAPESGRFTIETTGSTDTFLRLYLDDGMLALDGNSGSGNNAKIEEDLILGRTYNIAVHVYDQDETGDYALLIAGCTGGCGDDPGDDDSTTAGTLAGCGTIQEDIDCLGDVDWYRFQAIDDSTYTWSLSPTNRGGMILYAADATTEIDAGPNSVSTTMIGGDAVYIVVSAASATDTFTYGLITTGCPAGGCGDDPGNDDTANATDLGSQCGITGAAIDCDGDYDFYRFTAPSSDSYNFYTAGGTDTILTLYDHNGTPLTTDDDSAQDTNASIVYSLTQGSSYYITVNEHGDNATGGYHLYVSGCQAGGCGDDPDNDDLGHATDLGTSCASHQAAIDCADDDDYYAFTAPVAGAYQFSAGAGAAHLELMDPAAVVIDSNTFSVEATLTQGQLVFLRIRAFNAGNTFPYTLALTGCTPSGCGNDPDNDDIASATDLGTTCGSTSAAIDCVGDLDFYEFTSPRNGDFTFETTGSTDTFLLLMDNVGDSIVTDDDGGANLNARIVHTLIQGTTYFLAVSEFNHDDTGDYTLVISGCTSGDCGNDPGNDSPAEATDLGDSCGTTHAAFDCAADVDYYMFTPAVSGTFTLETRGSMDTLMRLEDNSGMELDSDDDSGTDLNALINTSLEAGTPYFIRIGEFGDDGTGAYDFLISGCDGSSPDTFNTIVTSVARVQGAAGTNWSSDLVILNNGDQTTLVTVSMWLRDQANPTPATTSRTLAPGEIWKETDVLGSKFGISDGAAALHIGADQPLGVASRTFNDTGAGTYGQFIAGVDESTAVQSGTTAVVSGLTENSAFRTNLGLVNPTSTQIVVNATFFSSNGDSLGTRSYTVPAFGYVQKNRVLTSLGVDNQSDAWVTLQSTDGSFFSFSSVIDNGSGDPVYRPGGAPPTQQGSALVAGLAKLAGASGTNWLSDVTILNSGIQNQTIRLSLWMRDANNDTPLQRTKVIPAGTVLTMADVLADTFGLQEGASSLVLNDAEGLIAGCRTYNQVASGTFGQYIPAMWGHEAVNKSRSGFLIMIQENNEFRTNLGLVNTSDISTDVVLRLIDENGLQIGSSKTVALAPRGVIQLNRVARQFTNIAVSAASLELTMGSSAPDGTVHAFASVIDQTTGDPIFESVTVTPID